MKKSSAPNNRGNHRERTLKRENFRCAVTGAVDSRSSWDRLTTPADGEALACCESAHILPFSLAPYISKFSRMVYPEQFFEWAAGGANINEPENGILMSAGLHKLYGRDWCISYEEGTYVVNNLRNVMELKFAITPMKFGAVSPPMPLLVNIHAAVTHTAVDLANVGLLTWEAAGEHEENEMHRSSSTLVAPATRKHGELVATSNIPELEI